MLLGTDSQMLFNTEKSKVMYFGFNNPQTEYDMNGVKLQTVNEEKDLDVIVSADLKWERQCIEVVKKANKMLGLIKRNFQYRSKATIVPLLLSLVRPHLESGLNLLNCVRDSWLLEIVRIMISELF